MTAEGVEADNLDNGGSMVGDPSLGTKFSSAATGRYTMIADISYDGSSFSLSSDAEGTFMEMGETPNIAPK